MRRPSEPAPGEGHPSRKPSETPPNSAEAEGGRSIRLGGGAADLVEGRVRAADGAETVLRPQSAAVLRALAARRGETVSKDALHAAVWGDIAVTEDSLVQCIGDIRRALGPDRDALRTLPKRGYRLAAEGPALSRPGWRLPCGRRGAPRGAPRRLPRPRRPPAAPAGGPVVAVLPFENLSEPGRWDRLARGVTEEVIADLATNSWIFVLADATTRPHAGANAAGGRARRSAPATWSPASLQADDGRVRIAAALADPANGRQVWARQWEGPADDLLVLQSAAAEALVGELAGHWSGAIALADRARAHEASTASLDAYDLYLLGIEHKHRMTPRDFDLAEDYLLRAVAIDPHFAKAWVGLSIVMGFKASSTADEGEVAALNDRLRDYAARAVAADPDDPSVLLQAGWAASLDGDLEARRPRHPPRGRAGPERRGRAGGRGMVGPRGWRNLCRRERLGGPGARAQPGGPRLVPAGQGHRGLRGGRLPRRPSRRSGPRPRDLPSVRSFSRRRTRCSATRMLRARRPKSCARCSRASTSIATCSTWHAPALRQRLRDGATRAGL